MKKDPNIPEYTMFTALNPDLPQLEKIFYDEKRKLKEKESNIGEMNEFYRNV